MLPVCAVVFFVSGFAALLYQVIWQRILAIFSGADVYSATIIVAAFMAGLGLGSLGGGYLADRVSRRSSLMFFGIAELAIAAFGSVSAAIYYDFLYLRLGHVELAPPVLATMLFVILLWPTFLMGASLPLLAKALTPRVERAALTVGLLYGLNTLGAATGALIGTWVLLPWVGLEQSLAVAAGLNATCALVVLPFAMSRRVAAQIAPPIESAPTTAAPTAQAAVTDGALGFRTLGIDLRVCWIPRTLARNRVVPHARRDDEGDIVHVRHAAGAVSCGPRCWIHRGQLRCTQDPPSCNRLPGAPGGRRSLRHGPDDDNRVGHRRRA
jgi:MFS family permease